MKRLLCILLLPVLSVSAQNYKLDTLPNAASYINSFATLPLPGQQMRVEYMPQALTSVLMITAKTSSSNLRALILSQKVSYKTIAANYGGKGYCWTYVFDNKGNVYLSMLYPRKVLMLNLKTPFLPRSRQPFYQQRGTYLFHVAGPRWQNVFRQQQWRNLLERI